MIDPEVASWLPQRTREELAAVAFGASALLEQPILVWKRAGEDVVLEDADRLELLQQRGIAARVQQVEFESPEEARRFVLARQLARRNLNGVRLRYVRGARYNLERAPGRRTDLATHPQSEGKSDVDLRFGCSRATIERDGRLARVIDEAAQVHGHEARVLLLGSRVRLTTRQLDQFAVLERVSQDDVLMALHEGRIHDILRPPAKPTPAPDSTAPTPAEGTSDIFGQALSDATSALQNALRTADEARRTDPSYVAILAVKLAEITRLHAALAGKLQTAPVDAPAEREAD